jgi:hypothetical protein
MVPRPFFSPRSKKQFRACGVFRKKVTDVKGIYLRAGQKSRMSQFAQCENVKYCQKLGKSASEMFQMFKQAYGEEALGRSAVFKGHKCFAQRRDSLEDEEHTGQPRTVRTEHKIQEVATLVRANRSEQVYEIAAAAAEGIRHGTRNKILSDDLNMSHVTQRSVPRVLT